MSMRWMMWCTIAWATWIGWRQEPSIAAERPNVIVVMTDDQGYGEFSCHGNPIAQTPNIDRLASESLRLTDFHVAPMCTPTRGQLMTGLDAFRNGATNVSSGRTLLRPELKTMADVFRLAGYRTAIFGKWHLGDNYPFRPQDRGFEEALWFPSSHVNSAADYWDNDYFDDVYIHNGKQRRYKGYCTDVFFREAISWMKSVRGERPFFVYLPLNAAHWPWFVPNPYRDPIRERLRANPAVGSRLKPERRKALISYLAMGANIDENMGRLEAFLRQSGLKKNTIVVFLTDNGSTMGPDYYNAGMRGRKASLWEGGHRVPCFIRWPQGELGQPRDIPGLTQVQDLLPTLADLAGIDQVPAGLDGMSLAPVLRGKQQRPDDRMLVINYSRMPFFRVTYTKRNPAIPDRNGALVMWRHWRLVEDRWLYDLRSDPHQDHDVAAERPEVVTKMRTHLDQWWAAVRDQVMQPQRIVIGSPQENPSMLSACDWLDVFIDQQRQIRRGERKSGAWHLVVEQAGDYILELRRWPKESDLALDAGIEATRVTDGTYEPGQALPIRAARLKIGNRVMLSKPDPSNQFVRFKVSLSKGPVTLQTWFLDAEDQPICGAYYIYVERTPEQSTEPKGRGKRVGRAKSDAGFPHASFTNPQ